MQSSTRKPVFVVHGISQHRLPDLLQVADAVDAVCLGSCRIQRRQEHPRKNGDDRYHDQELYQGKNPYFYPAKEESRTENREVRSRKTLEQSNIKTFE